MNKTTLVSLLALTACATETAPTEPVLDLDTNEADRIAGTYTEDGVTVAFEFARDRDRHVTAFESAAGEPLLTTTLEGAFETTRIFDGRMVVSGPANQPNPTIEGDTGALDELHARPEAALLEGLQAALEGKGIDPTLFAPEEPQSSNVYDNGDGYFLFEPGESLLFWSNGWGGWTTLWARNPWPNAGSCALVTMVPHSAAPAQYVVVPPPSPSNPWAWTHRAVNWWGALFRVENAGSARYIAGNYCRPTQVLVQVF